MGHNLFKSLNAFPLAGSRTGEYYSLPQLEKEGVGPVSRLPFSIRILLESVLRNCDRKRIREEDVARLANWSPNSARTDEVPFVVARILLQDFTGVPLLVDLAAMRSAVERMGKSAGIIEPLVPVDLIIDHSVQVDSFGSPDSLQLNLDMEVKRNHARYRFLKWGMQGFRGFNVIPPGVGICHQVNLEFLAKVVQEKEGVYYPDTLVGTDSHTTMINGLGVMGWGVGGIEAEAGMLGQPVYFLTPDVIGVRVSGRLREGVTATDLVLHVTELLRKTKVVGKFVEFYGPGVSCLPVTDRATISNMAPEYGATLALFPVDDETCAYLRDTGREQAQIEAVRNYYKAQQMYGAAEDGRIEYSSVLELNLEEIEPSVAGPKRPQDRIPLQRLKQDMRQILLKPPHEGGYGRTESDLDRKYPFDASKNSAADTTSLQNGSVVIAAITSCTNTSNPNVMIAAGLLAKKAVEFGIAPPPYVKTSLAPGSRVVSDYLEKAGLQKYLDKIGFNVVGYGCTTCIGNSGPLHPAVEELIAKQDLVLASVLSGNRNFEARIHQSVKANFLMSPPLVVAFALAGRIDIDLTGEPLGRNAQGRTIYLHDIWPKHEEIRRFMGLSLDPGSYRRMYSDFAQQNPLWNDIPSGIGALYEWDRNSTYIQEPPYFDKFRMEPEQITEISGARPLAILGDSVTTDHISPAGSIKPSSPAGAYLQEKGVMVSDFNSYGSRRGNHEVMVRGTFANVRMRNLMVPGSEGGVTKHYPSGEQMDIYEAACRYQESGTPLVIFAGQEYGTGSSRDWAAKGTFLLGVRAVIAQSFERIHRSNLVGMGVLPCQFKDGMSVRTLNLNGSETFDIRGIGEELKPRQDASLIIHRIGNKTEVVPLAVRVDTPIEVEYYRHGGILPYVLRRLLQTGAQ
ncbi:MAG: aconitate hydratase AcnA [Acidobacteria bacterium]|nr:aconitate hydratase AcnA [Acidobacteriota bacterium]